MPYTSTPPTKNLIDNPISLETSFETKLLNDLQTIVIYGRNHSAYDRLLGTSLQLFFNDTMIYNKEISDLGSNSQQLGWRFDGPDIVNVSSFAASNSTTQIVSDSYSKIIKYVIDDYLLIPEPEPEPEP